MAAPTVSGGCQSPESNRCEGRRKWSKASLPRMDQGKTSWNPLDTNQQGRGNNSLEIPYPSIILIASAIVSISSEVLSFPHPPDRAKTLVFPIPLSRGLCLAGLYWPMRGLGPTHSTNQRALFSGNQHTSSLVCLNNS